MPVIKLDSVSLINRADRELYVAVFPSRFLNKLITKASGLNTNYHGKKNMLKLRQFAPAPG